MKVCSLYGAGFYYIPGTDTGIKIGGYVRSEINYNAAGSFNPGGMLAGANSQNDRAASPLAWRTRIYTTWDVRSQTSMGTLRSYARAAWQWLTGDFLPPVRVPWPTSTPRTSSSRASRRVSPRRSTT